MDPDLQKQIDASLSDLLACIDLLIAMQYDLVHVLGPVVERYALARESDISIEHKLHQAWLHADSARKAMRIAAANSSL